MGFDIRGAGAGADATGFVFDEEFSDEGFAETVVISSSKFVFLTYMGGRTDFVE